MKFISNVHHVTDEVMHLINDKGSPNLQELCKLLNELNAEFNVFAESIHLASSRCNAYLVTANGLPCGNARIEHTGTNATTGVREYRYTVKLPTIKKDRSGPNSSREERESNKLSTLIRSIKKNNEVPTEAGVAEACLPGIGYAYAAVKSNKDEPEIRMDSACVLNIVEHHLSVDKNVPLLYINDMKIAYEEYKKLLCAYTAHNKNYERYRKGCKIVGILDKSDHVKDGATTYLIGEMGDVGTDIHNYTHMFHSLRSPLKAYRSLSDTPLAGIAAMCRAHFPQSDYVKNELNIPHNDRYHEDLDIATGYRSREILWVVIPNEAP